MSAPSPRRRFLRTWGGGALALPILESLRAAGGLARPARAASPLRGRFVGFFTTGGTVPARHYPRLPGQPPVPDTAVPVDFYTSGMSALDTASFVMSPVLEPLEPHRKDLLILEGIDPRFHGGHDFGKALTGRTWGESRQAPCASLDQEIAKLSTTKFRSLELGVDNRNQGDKTGQVSWLAAGQPAKAQNNPAEVWKRVFAGLPAAAVDPAATAAFERQRVLGKSLLDDTIAQTAALKAGLAAGDAQKLDNYLESLRDVERRLYAPAPPTPTRRCAPPPAPAALNPREPAQYATITKLQIDMLALALACDLVSVATLIIGHGGTPMTHPWLGINDPLHMALGHAPSTDLEKQRKLVRINTWYASQFAYLVERLRSFDLLGETVCLWLLELSRGNKHSNFNAPVVLAGSGSGAVKTGRYVRFDRQGGKPRTEVELYTVLARGLGLPIDVFGDPAYHRRPMTELRADGA